MKVALALLLLAVLVSVTLAAQSEQRWLAKKTGKLVASQENKKNGNNQKEITKLEKEIAEREKQLSNLEAKQTGVRTKAVNTKAPLVQTKGKGKLAALHAGFVAAANQNEVNKAGKQVKKNGKKARKMNPKVDKLKKEIYDRKLKLQRLREKNGDSDDKKEPVAEGPTEPVEEPAAETESDISRRAAKRTGKILNKRAAKATAKNEREAAKLKGKLTTLQENAASLKRQIAEQEGIQTGIRTKAVKTKAPIAQVKGKGKLAALHAGLAAAANQNEVNKAAKQVERNGKKARKMNPKLDKLKKELYANELAQKRIREDLGESDSKKETAAEEPAEPVEAAE